FAQERPFRSRACGANQTARNSRNCSTLLGRKGAAAATVPRRVGILENESLAHQRLFVLERRAVQEQKAFRVHEEARAVFFEDLVAIPRLSVEAHGIRETGAATALHANAQAAHIGRHTFFFEQRADFLRGTLGQLDLRDVRAYYFSCHTNSSSAER